MHGHPGTEIGLALRWREYPRLELKFHDKKKVSVRLE